MIDYSDTSDRNNPSLLISLTRSSASYMIADTMPSETHSTPGPSVFTALSPSVRQCLV